MPGSETIYMLCSQCQSVNPPGFEGDTCLSCGTGIIFCPSQEDLEIEELRDFYSQNIRELKQLIKEA